MTDIGKREMRTERKEVPPSSCTPGVSPTPKIPFPYKEATMLAGWHMSFNGKPIPSDPPMTVSNTGLETYPTGDWTSSVIIHVVISKIVGTLKTHQHKMSKAFNFFMSVGFSCPRRAEKGHEGLFKTFNPQDPQTHSPYISFEKS